MEILFLLVLKGQIRLLATANMYPELAISCGEARFPVDGVGNQPSQGTGIVMENRKRKTNNRKTK